MALTRLARVSALALALAASFELAAAPAFAQRYQDSGGTAVPGFVPVQPGVGPLFTSANPGKISGTFSATLAGFAPGNAYATRTVGATSSNVALPSGTVIVVYNTGANAAFVKLGTSNSVVADSTNDSVPAGGWMAFTVGANTWLAAIETAGTTSLNISGGSGLPTGSGGGGGSSGLPAGAATSAMQTTGNTSAAATAASAATIATNTAALAGLGSGGTGTGLTVTCTNCSGGGGGGSGGGSTPQTTAGGAINVTTAATTRLITGVSGQYTYITAYNFIAAGATNVSLEYGSTTSNPCDTSAVVIDGPVALTAQAGKGQGSGLGTVLPPIPQGKDVCIVNSAAIQVGGSLNYTQSTTVAGSFGGGGSGGSSSPFASNGNYVNVPSITSTSANSSLPSGGGTAILMSNYGSSAVMVQLSASGSSTVTAATADDIIPANSTHSIAVGSNTNIAYATLSGSSSLQITGGAGQFTGAGGGGGGSSSGNADQRITAVGTISAADTAANFTTGANGQSVITWTGLPTTNSHAEFAGFSGVQTGLLICAGTFTGTFEFDTMMDNASPSKYLKQTIELSGGGAPDKISSFTGPVMGRVSLDGAIGGRIRATSTPTGTPVCTLNLTSNLHEIHVSNILPAGKTTNIGLSTSTTGAQLVAGATGQSIRVSAWDAIAAGTTNLSLGWSASTACTSITKLAGPYPLIVNTGIARGDGVASIITVPAGDTLCIISDGAVAVGGSVQTTQF